MRRERRQPTHREWAAITNSRLVVRCILRRRPDNPHSPGPESMASSLKSARGARPGQSKLWQNGSMRTYRLGGAA
jgi:hypothetical protein